MAIETVSRMRHPTETMSLSIYNRMFSMQSDPLCDGRGQVVYYDATQDDYIDELPPSKASEVKLPAKNKMVLLRFE